MSIDEPSGIIEARVNKTKVNYSYQTGEAFKYIKIPKECKIINGDNWYIVLGNDGIIDSCYLSNDEFAEMEFNTVMSQLMTNQQTAVDTLVSLSKR